MGGLYTTQWKQILTDFNLLFYETQTYIHSKSVIISKSVSSVTLLGITIDLKRTYQQCYKKGIV